MLLLAVVAQHLSAAVVAQHLSAAVVAKLQLAAHLSTHARQSALAVSELASSAAQYWVDDVVASLIVRL